MTLLTTTYDPATHKLVPRQLTEEMISAALKNGFEGEPVHLQSDWDCLLNAAPAAPPAPK